MKCHFPSKIKDVCSVCRQFIRHRKYHNIWIVACPCNQLTTLTILRFHMLCVLRFTYKTRTGCECGRTCRILRSKLIYIAALDETCSDIWHRCCAVIVFKWMLRLNFQSQLHGKFELMACQLNAMILKRNQVFEKKVRFQFFCCFRSDFHVKCVENWNMLFISVQILTVFFLLSIFIGIEGPLFVGAWNKKTNNRNIIEKKYKFDFFLDDSLKSVTV